MDFRPPALRSKCVQFWLPSLWYLVTLVQADLSPPDGALSGAIHGVHGRELLSFLQQLPKMRLKPCPGARYPTPAHR